MSVTQPVSSVVLGVTAAGIPVIYGFAVVSDDDNIHVPAEREISPVNSDFISTQNKIAGNVEFSESHVKTSTVRSETKIVENSLQGTTGVEAVTNEEDKPIATSEQFERKRTPSLAAALLSAEHAPGHKAFVHFVRPSADSTLIECESAEDNTESSPPSAETLVASLLRTLKSLQMSDTDRYTSALRRLQDLEHELRVADAVCPPNSNVLDTVAKALSGASLNSDVQIRYNTTRHTKSTKTYFETETPGMEGLNSEKIQQLHQQLINNLSTATTDKTKPDDSGSSVTEQKHESAAEGYTNDDGSVVVSKKMTRVVTTTRTAVSGEPEQNAGDLIRLKVNEQVYSGTVDPQDQHIRLVPIIQSQDNAQQQQSQLQQQQQSHQFQ